MKNLILILIVLSSCSPIKRHNRIVNKFPYVHTIDSVTLIDTIRLTTNKVVSDTVVHENTLYDTITITKDNLTVRVVKINDSIFINGKCDTIYIDTTVKNTVPIVHYKEVVKNKSNKWLWVIIAFLVLIVFLRR